MKRPLQFLLFALIVLAGVLIANTLRVPVPAAAAAAPTDGVVVDSALAAERLSGAVKFATVSIASGAPIDTAAFLGFHDFIATAFPRVHATLRRETVNGLSLIYTWVGRDSLATPVVLMGHMDVVPVPESNLNDWTHGPFSGDIAEGYVWGRGTLDDKTTVLSSLEAVEALLAQGFTPARTVYLTFGHDEEVGGRFGARAIVDTLVARGVKPAMVLDEGGIMTSGLVPGVKQRAAVVGIAEKGYLSLRLRAQATGGHSSMPLPRTAVGALSRAVAALEANPFPYDMQGPARGMLDAMAPYVPFAQRVALANLWLTEPVVTRMLSATPSAAAMLHTTTSPTMLSAGVKDNVLPPEAMAVVNFRIRPGETMESVTQRVRTVINDTLIVVEPTDSARVNPSPVSDTKSPAYQLIDATIRQMAPGEQIPVLPYLVVGGTDAKYWGDHSANVYRFLPIPLGDGDFPRIHGLNERVAVKDYAVAVGFFARLIKGLDALPR
jgi:carboxypeptidase PM20D1